MSTVSSMKTDIQTERERSTGGPLVFYKGSNLRLLNLNGFVQELSSLLSRVAPTRINRVVTNRVPYLLVDQEEMGQACTALTRYGSEIVGRGATVTVSGGLLPIDMGEKDEGRGCALVTISVHRYGSPVTRVQRRDMLRDLTAVKKTVEKHNGSFRIWRRRGEARFNIYLPVLYRA